MDKIQKYPQTVSSAVRVDSKGSTLELALAAINVALAGKATSQDLESLKADLLASIAEKATINDLVENEYTIASSLTEMSERINNITGAGDTLTMTATLEDGSTKDYIIYGKESE